MADGDAERDGDQHLDVELAVEGLRRGAPPGRRGRRCALSFLRVRAGRPLMLDVPPPRPHRASPSKGRANAPRRKRSARFQQYGRACSPGRAVRISARARCPSAAIRTSIRPREDRHDGESCRRRSRPARRLRRRGAAALLVAAVVVALGARRARGRPARRAAGAEAELADRAAAALPLATASLAAVIEKQRLIPMVLARDPEVIALLAAPDRRRRATARRQARRDRRRGQLGGDLSRRPRRRSRSPPATPARPSSFVGSDYGFRTYFTGGDGRGRGAAVRARHGQRPARPLPVPAGRQRARAARRRGGQGRVRRPRGALARRAGWSSR